MAGLSVVVTGTILGAGSNPAFATSYPSYADVQAAKASQAAKTAEIATLQGLLASLQTDVQSTQAAAVQKGAEAQTAQTNYDDATNKLVKLTQQADSATQEANKSKQEAGQLAAQQARSGGTDLTAKLFFGGSKTNGLLSQLGLASMVKDQSSGLYAKAIQNAQAARSLTNQAALAKTALKTLNDDAQKAAAAAVAASQAAADALAAQQTHQIELNAQLAVLTSNTNQTQAAYNAGVAAAQAAAAAAAAASKTPAASAPAGQVTSSGWTRPSAGHISSPYGYRIDPYTGAYALHEGTDLAPGCNSPIYAAHSGTVVMAGPYGGYGNYIRINNNDGTYMTAYGHIVNGGILVHVGQTVSVGQNIARVGSTGWSTGCHLHFEVYQHGTTIDPVPFMRAHGVELAN
jgi:murein DD-endopeptidase MepM/ murein hydrolase activator NlpD